jgi:hypothetical protein
VVESAPKPTEVKESDKIPEHKMEEKPKVSETPASKTTSQPKKQQSKSKKHGSGYFGLSFD